MKLEAKSNNDLIIGSHVSMKNPELYLGSVKEALSFNETTFMIYTGSPQTTLRTPVEKCFIGEANNLILKSSKIYKDKIVCHMPYLINLGNEIGSDKFNFSLSLLKSELTRCHHFGIKLCVLHPGCYLKGTIGDAIKNIASGINEALLEVNDDSIICLETMAGKGTEVGKNLSEIKAMIDLIDNKNRVGVCIDTCHLNDAGYDLSNFDNFLDEFDKIIGLNYLKIVHLNDSCNQINSHKDRHANIGFGTLGFDTLFKIAHNAKIKDVPKILETPYINGKPPYKEEIQMLIDGKFNSHLKDLFN